MTSVAWGWCVGFWIMFGAWLVLLDASRSKDKTIDGYIKLLDECQREYGRMLSECHERLRRVK